MKVNHKTFRGGYSFRNFQGSKVGSVVTFGSVSDSANVSIDLPDSPTGYDVLKALKVTAFTGPEYAVLPTEGDIEATQVKEIIINAVEAEPYNISTNALLEYSGFDKFSAGIKAISESFGNAKIKIVLTENEKTLIEKMIELSNELSYLTVVSVAQKYPVNMTPLLVQTVLETKYPVGYSSPQIGVLCVDIWQVLTVEKAVVSGKSINTRIVALAGPSFKENVHLEVPLGTQISDITSNYITTEEEVRIVKNSIMTGPKVSDNEVVDPFTSVLIALPEDRKRKPLFFFRPGAKADSYTNSFISALLPNGEKTAETNVHGEHRACVNCTYCQTVCPMGLYPQLLFKHVDKDIITERLAELKIHDCIGCNLCNYVCPSKIDVAGNIQRGKGMLEEREIPHAAYLLDGCDLINDIKEEVEASE